MPPSAMAAQGASEVEEIKGDWVLFHPVYTPDELKAVEVSLLTVLHHPTVISDRGAPIGDASRRENYVRQSRGSFRSAAQVFSAESSDHDSPLIFFGILRWGFDFASRYKHKDIPPKSNMSLEELRKQGYVMDDSQWLAVRLISWLFMTPHSPITRSAVSS